MVKLMNATIYGLAAMGAAAVGIILAAGFLGIFTRI